MKTRVFTAGVLVRGGKVLVLKRKTDDDTYPGLWDCLGGHFEAGESAEECMSREAREESGLGGEAGQAGEADRVHGRVRSLDSGPLPSELSVSAECSLSEHSEFGG